MTHEFELTFEEFFERFYDAGQEEKALKVWAEMIDQEAPNPTFQDAFDEWETEITEMQTCAILSIEEQEEDAKCSDCLDMPADDLCDACEVKLERKNLHKIAELSIVDESDDEVVDLLKGGSIQTTYLPNAGSVTISKK
jgi:hypothetical protein